MPCKCIVGNGSAPKFYTQLKRRRRALLCSPSPRELVLGHASPQILSPTRCNRTHKHCKLRCCLEKGDSTVSERPRAAGRLWTVTQGWKGDEQRTWAWHRSDSCQRATPSSTQPCAEMQRATSCLAPPARSALPHLPPAQHLTEPPRNVSGCEQHLQAPIT